MSVPGRLESYRTVFDTGVRGLKIPLLLEQLSFNSV